MNSLIGPMSRHFHLCAVIALVALGVAAKPATADETPAFDITVDSALAAHPLTGRLYVFLQPVNGQQSSSQEPRFGPNWFSPEPFFGFDVKNAAANESLRIDDSADGFPDKLSRLAPENIARRRYWIRIRITRTMLWAPATCIAMCWKSKSTRGICGVPARA